MTSAALPRAASTPSPEGDAFARDFAEKGYAIIDMSGDAAVIALCDGAIADVSADAAAGYNRVQDVWRRSAAVRTLAGLPRVTDALAALHGRAPFPFQTLNFHRGSQQAPHADTLHFDSAPTGFMCGVWLALEDVHPDAGPLIYYPGSHKLPVLTFQDIGAEDNAPRLRAYPDLYEPAIAQRIAQQGFASETALLRKGQALVWASNLIHGGASVTDAARTRRSLVTHYYFDDCDYFTWTTSKARPRRRRLPSDVRTGRFVWPRGGAPDWRQAAFETISRATARVHRFVS